MQRLQELAINYPGRVDKLVLACTWAKTDGTSGISSEFIKAAEAYEKSSHDVVSQRRLAGIMMDLQINKWSYRVFLLPLMKIAIRFSIRSSSPKPGVAEQMEAGSAHDAADRLGMIKASTLVITGTEDRLINPVSSEVIASLIPKAKLVKVSGGSHSFSIEMRGEFNKEVLDFLQH